MRLSNLYQLILLCCCSPALFAAQASPAPPGLLDAPRTLAELWPEFRNPSNAYRIQFLLRTNDEVSQEEIEWQVRTIREQGGGGVFSYCEHLEGGSPEKFLTDWWWQVVDWTAGACAKENVLYWAYDEEDWPSGTAGGLLLQQHPELTWNYLRKADHEASGPNEVDLAVADEPFVAAVAFQVTDGRLLPDSLTDITELVKERHLRWKPPQGAWTVAVYTAATAKVWNAANYPDLMSRRAGEAFVDLVYRAHDDRVRKIPGARLTGFFTDEPSMSMANYPAGKLFPWVPAAPYSPDVREAFQREYGYDFRRLIPLLYYDAGPQSIRFRCQYWRLCNRLYAENYFGRMYRFCDERGQIASGHVHAEESLMAHLNLQGGDMMSLYRQMHIPGIDWIYPFQNPLPANVPKYVSSASHLTGRARAWCESFAASGWGLTFQQMRRMVNWEHVNGINMQIPICYKYSVRGPKRARFYTPGISYQQPYWDHFRGFADYEARLCVLASGLGHQAQVALFYPSVDLWAHCWEHDLLSARSVTYNRLGDAMRDAGYDYDVLDDQAIQHDGQVKDGTLATPTERFPVLLLPQMDAVSRPTLERAVSLVGAGGTVLIQGDIPRHSLEAGGDDPEIARLVNQLLGDSCREQIKAGKPFWHRRGRGKAGFVPRVEDLVAMLRETAAPDLLMDAGSEGVCAYHRRLPDGDLYLVLNRRDTTRTVHFTLASAGFPEIWDPVTGEAKAVPAFAPVTSGTRLTLSMAPDEIVPVVFRPSPGTAPLPPGQTLAEVPIPGPFRFRIEQTMARPHVAWNFTQIKDGWTVTTQPAVVPGSQPADVPRVLPAGDWCQLGLAGFSGLGHYETEIDVPQMPSGAKAILDLGRVAVSAEVFLNGQSAGLVVFDPYRLDVTRLIKPGRNHLRIAVANTLANYYGQFKECQTAPLNAGGVRPEHKVSGLLGPVVLRVMR